MYKLLLEKSSKDCFPNVEVILRMYLSLMITNSSGERPFSKLKRIKNRLRIYMLEERLFFFLLCSALRGILRQLKYENITGSFSTMKCRRKAINH